MNTKKKFAWNILENTSQNRQTPFNIKYMGLDLFFCTSLPFDVSNVRNFCKSETYERDICVKNAYFKIQSSADNRNRMFDGGCHSLSSLFYTLKRLLKCVNMCSTNNKTKITQPTSECEASGSNKWTIFWKCFSCNSSCCQA